MSEATGIHDHPTLKLGLRPKDEVEYARALAFGDHLTVVPTHPISVDDTIGMTFGMDLNDRIGDCVVAGWDHFQQLVRQLLTGSSIPLTDSAIIALYRTQNPDFDLNGDPAVNGPGSPADRGMNIQTFLGYLQKSGQILGFAKVDHTSEEEIKAAIFLGLGIVGGYAMQVAQQQQAVFTYVSGSPTWGGHCMVKASYLGTPDEIGEVTWGKVVQSSVSFLQQCCDEAWFVILPEHVAHPGFRAGFDLVSFADAFTALTGRSFPVTPPQPQPPPPPPAPGGSLAVAVQALVSDPDTAHFVAAHHATHRYQHVAHLLQAVIAATQPQAGEGA